jgi:hypothetical protein
MKIETMEKKAHAIDHEFIVDESGDICIRPMHFEKGIRQVRQRPDPVEFLPPAKAEAKLRELIQQDRYERRMTTPRASGAVMRARSGE